MAAAAPDTAATAEGETAEGGIPKQQSVDEAAEREAADHVRR
ncbi:hypothetical protein GA0115246_112733 [Streptomyces sp. SolWspMP-sol7th]|nr:hypothetical protein [Streptomyces sp. SolWspMP-sol7th]SCE22308.1 hypothetical protein GA0115246_112733 [Streptomyces sp. SolWspMP-sol7th]